MRDGPARNASARSRCSPTPRVVKNEMRNIDHVQRFWARIRKTDGCWDWIGSIDGAGYGQLMMSGKMRGAHRVAWALTNGPIPTGLLGCHHCDNRRCCRPGHLFVGTRADNGADRDRKGRRRGPVRLTYADVVLIRSRPRRDAPELAARYGVSVQ